MSSTENDLNAFTEFAKSQISADNSHPSIDELFDAWRIQNPAEGDLLAIKASLRDLEAGERGTPIEQFNKKMAGKFDLN